MQILRRNGISKIQEQARDLLLQKISTGLYKQIENPCAICKISKSAIPQIEKVIAKVDRYGIPNRTVMCGRCGMLRTDPIFRESDYTDFYQNHYRELYSGAVETSDDFFDEQLRRGIQIRKLLDDYVSIDGKTVVEVGTGAGGILRGVIGDDAFGIGCDYGIDYLKFAQSKALSVLQGSINSLASNSTDILIYSHVLEHIANPAIEIDEMYRVLKNDGLVLVIVPGLYSIHRHYGGRLSQYLQSAHLHHYTREHLRKVMSNGGFAERYGSQGVTAIFTKKSDLIDQFYFLQSNLRSKIKIYFAVMKVVKFALSAMLYVYLEVRFSSLIRPHMSLISIASEPNTKSYKVVKRS